MRALLIITLLTFSFLSKETQSETITIAAIDWCPQICPKKQEQGYVVDFVKEIFKDSEYQLEIQYFPWSRAIKQVLSGKVDALLSPAKAEAPSLLFPQHEVGVQKMCFFTKVDSQWTYLDVASLKGLQVGIAIDTSIEELNSYVVEHLEQFQFQPYHERYILQNAGKLQKNRIDTFLFTKNSTIYELMQAGIWQNYREAGCVSEAKIYMAFTPEQSSRAKVKALIEYFDRRAELLNHSSYIQQLMQNYHL
ncbi:substrate-binding periplasmic protein [Colwelliaceae bacterium 6441]